MRRATVSVLGVCIAIEASDRHAEAVIDSIRPRAVLDNATGEPELFYEVRDVDALDVDVFHVVTRTTTGYELIDAVESIDDAAALIVNDLHPRVAEQVPHLLVIHAGAVAWQGTAIIVPGRSHSGKSSLIAALLQRGADYLSDEFALLDTGGHVHPYPRHLSIRSDDGSTTLVAPEAFGAATQPASVPLGLIVVTHYRPQATFVPTASRGAQSLLPLIDNTLVAQSRPRHTMKFIAGLTGRVHVVHSDRGEASDAAESILSYASQLELQR